MNEREALFASKLVLDEDELEEYLEKNAQQADDAAEMATTAGEGEDEKPPRPFANAS